MKIRHLCAILGVAVAVGAEVFTASLVETNSRQGLVFARRMLEAMPIAEQAKTTMLAPDYRPDGIPMQGRPLMALVATRDDGSIPKNGIVVSKALFAQRRLAPPAIGTELQFTGRRGAYTLKIVDVVDWRKPVRGYPNSFVSAETASLIEEDWKPYAAKSAEELAPGFSSDEGRNLDSAKPLLLGAAFLTALCLIVNSIFLSIEAKRRELAILRMIGLTRFGVVARCAKEAISLAAEGAVSGIAIGVSALLFYACGSKAFPAGAAISYKAIVISFVASLVVAFLAVLFSLRSALSVRPVELASSRMPRRRNVGTVIAFAFGFGSFIAVEVWGASLMSAFVPSVEWPDAIVSILPGGVSSYDIAKLQEKIPGVKRIAELAPLQVDIRPLEELKGFGGETAARGPKQYRNALLLASEWIPDFKFVQGDHDSAAKALKEGDNCIITEMMARARKLNLGDSLELDCGRGLEMSLKIVGVVDLNWHMVTSRALVRGLNRKPVNTDGPVFVSFDTLEAADLRPSAVVGMTHVWLDYEPEFLAANGVFGAGRKVEQEIVKALGGAVRESENGVVRGNNVQLHSRDEVADGTLAHGVELIGTMARIPFIFIVVLAFGFVAMMVASADSRKREFVVLRTIGATRLHLAMRLVSEVLRVAFAGVVVGFLGGAASGWAFTSVTRAAMANWGLPPSFGVPWESVAWGVACSVLITLVVAVPAAMVIVHKAMKR